MDAIIKVFSFARVNRQARIASVNYDYWRREPALPGQRCDKCSHELKEYALVLVNYLDKREPSDGKLLLCRECLPLPRDGRSQSRPATTEPRAAIVRQEAVHAHHDKTGWSVVQDGFVIHQNLDYDTAAELVALHQAAPSMSPAEAEAVLKIKTRGSG